MKNIPCNAAIAAAVVCMFTAAWAVPVSASTDTPSQSELQQQIQQLNQEIRQLQNQSQQLGQQVEQLKKKQEQKQKPVATASTTYDATAASATPSASKSANKTYLGGAFYLNYARSTDQGNSGTGDGSFSYLSLNANGNFGKMKWGFDEWIGPSSWIADKALMHLAWVSYDFGSRGTVTGGFFQVPFGNYPYGYHTFWGSMGYYTGFNDNQALGAGYTFEKSGWRWDLDVFKNYDAGQNSLYSGNPFQEYRMIDTGNTRLAYTFGKDTHNTVNASASFRGGHLQIGEENGHYGSHWAGALAADAELGDWTLQGQVVLYKYNVPAGRVDSSGNAISRRSVLMENFGFESARIPAAGIMYTFNVARTFNFKNLQPIDNVQLFTDFGYLKSRNGKCDNSVSWAGRESSLTCAGGTGYRMGNIMSVTPGAITTMGSFTLWTEVILGKNDALRFIGPNDNQWHARYNIEAVYYFGGNVM